MPRPATSRVSGRSRAGQAMVETIVVSLFLLVAFLLAVQFADNLRTKLLLQHAAARCVRARTVGLDDYMVLKTARLAVMPVSGECRSVASSGGSLDAHALVNRSGAYLESENEAEAGGILDFAYWDDGHLNVVCGEAGSGLVRARVRQFRPQFFDLARFFAGGEATPETDADDESRLTLAGEATIEHHAKDYLQ